MSISKVREYLKIFNMEERILEFERSSATVSEAAIAAGTSEGEIAKSLSFLINEIPTLIVVAGDVKVDNQKFKETFKTKAKMLSFDEVEPLIGHAVGGVCPFAINDGVNVYLDKSLTRYENVYPACGSSNSAIKLTISELEKTSNYISWVDVCKPII